VQALPWGVAGRTKWKLLTTFFFFFSLSLSNLVTFLPQGVVLGYKILQPPILSFEQEIFSKICLYEMIPSKVVL
jgi:hypothetical protein